jgi:hypothetical protein
MLAAMGDQPPKEKRRNEYRYLWYFFLLRIGAPSSFGAII